MKPVIISEKGQVTIPKRLRDRLGLAPGVAIEFHEQQGKLIGLKVASKDDPVAAVTGIIKAVDTDAYLDESRGPVE